MVVFGCEFAGGDVEERGRPPFLTDIGFELTAANLEGGVNNDR
jgi:hypothetical protein